MKTKIFTLLTCLFAASSMHASKLWNISDSQFNSLGTITSTITVDEMTLYGLASEEKNITIDANNKEIDGLSFTHRLKFGGKGRATHNLISFPVDGSCLIEVYCMAGKSGEDRQLRFDCGSFGGTELAVITAGGNAISKHVIPYDGEATTIYVYSVENPVNIYAIRASIGGQMNTNAKAFWKLDPMLTILGEGPMDHYDSQNDVPWIDYKKYLPGNQKHTEIRIEEGITVVGKNAFRDFEFLQNISLPSTITQIGREAFEGTAYLNNPGNYQNGVVYLDNWLIRAPINYRGEHAILEGTVGIANGAFIYCADFTSVVIPDGLLFVGEKAFSECASLTQIEIPNCVTTLYNLVFLNSTALHSVILGTGVTNIPSHVFQNCTGLHSFTCYSQKPPHAVGNVFEGVDLPECKLYVPKESVAAYRTTNVWKDFGSIIGIEVPEEHEAVENTSILPAASTTKTLRNGQILILRDDRTYTLTGQQIK